MDWLLDHIKLVIIVGVVIASWIKKRSETKRGEEATRRAVEQMANESLAMPPRQEPKPLARVAPTPPRQAANPMSQARTSPPPLATTRPISNPPPIAKAADNQNDLLQRQRDLQDRLADIKKAKAIAKAEPSGGARLTQQQTRGSEIAKTQIAGPSLRESLNNPQLSRRAFVLGEILGPPVALK